jgi:uncharacterized membrane protein
VQYRWFTQETPDGKEWLLRRNCVLKPGQLALLMSIAGALSLAVALGWGSQGVWWILPFAIIEITGLTAAFLIYSRHAADLDRIVVGPAQVKVEIVDGLRVTRAEGKTEWTRVAYQRGRKALIELSLPGQQLALGRFVPDTEREKLAKELAVALGVKLSVSG